MSQHDIVHAQVTGARQLPQTGNFKIAEEDSTSKFEQFSAEYSKFKQERKHKSTKSLNIVSSTPATVADEYDIQPLLTSEALIARDLAPSEPPTFGPERMSNPPVKARTMGVIAYTCLTLGLLCALAVMMAADASSGLVQGAIQPLRAEVKPVSCEPQPENDGHIIHIDCPLRRLSSFNVALEFAPNLIPFKGIFFEMKVEMYQYSLVPGFLRSTVDGTWSESLIPSQSGWSWWSQKKNPDYFPHVPGAGRHFGPNLYGGGFKLERPHLIDFHGKQLLSLKDDGAYIPSTERPPTRLSSTNTRLYDNHLYSGDPLKPQVGDIRVSFYGSKATHLSAIGEQSNSLVWRNERALRGFNDPFTRANRTRTLVLEGDYTAHELLDTFAAENDIPKKYLWGTRLFGFTVTTLWVFFTFQLVRRDTGREYSPSKTIAASMVVAASICMALIGVTNLTFSVVAAVACLIGAVFVFFLSFTCRGPIGAEQQGYVPLESQLQVAPPNVSTGASNTGSVKTSSYVAL